MHQVRDTTYGRLIAVVGAGGAVDLVGIVGYYSMICMTINAFQVPVPAGTSAPFESPG
jgi:4-carboxymuconolactone decarboxylase